MRLEDREKARALRRQGATYGEILRTVQVAKSTLNSWLRDIELTEEQKRRILELESAQRGFALSKGPWRNREKSQQRIRNILSDARRELPKLITDPFFVAGLVLYWAEGSKTMSYFQFTNSDPNAIRLMMIWLEQCLGVSRQRIFAKVYVHRVYADSGFGPFWEGVTGLPPSQFYSPYFKPTPHRIKRNPSYIGCCRLQVYSSELFWKLRGWHEEFLNHLGLQMHERLDGLP